MRYGVVAALSVLLFGVQAGHAQSELKFDVQELYQDCKSTVGSPDYAYCLGVVTGAGYLMLMVNGARTSMQDSHDADFLAALGMCPSDVPTFDAEVQAFVNWAHDHPEHGEMPAGIGVQMALSGAWPCS